MISNIIIKTALSTILIVAGATLTSASWNDDSISVNNSFSTSTAQDTDIVLNEFMADPIGNDKAAMPAGEWMELYNNGNWPIDVAGWYLYDAQDNNDLAISGANVSGGSTIINAKGYLVVYRNNENDFSLNNNGDTLRLYNGQIGISIKIDEYIYPSSIENKTWARIPDGIGSWAGNQTPTPGLAN